MRIGILCHASFGGSARVATELAVALAKRGHQIHLFTRTMPFDYWQQMKHVVLHQLVCERQPTLHPATLYTDWPSEEFERFVGRVFEVTKKEQLDVLHFHYALPFAFVMAEIKRRLGQAAPVLIGTLHGTDVTLPESKRSKRAPLREALQALDGLTTVSAAHARLVREVFAVEAQIIPNFVDLSRFRPAKQKEKRPKIVHISNFRPIKNTPSVARIFLAIRHAMRCEAELWLIGDGEDMGRVKAILAQSELQNEARRVRFLRKGTLPSHVRYWGLQHDVAPLLAQADLLLVTSQYESFCLTALEAMACGVPVLATKVGGLPEVVVHGKTGYLFPLGEHDQAVDWAIKLLSDPIQHRAMRQAARERAAHFAVEKIVSIYEKLYRRVLKRGLGNF